MTATLEKLFDETTVSDFLRRVGGHIVASKFKPNGYIVLQILEFDDRISRALNRPHRVEIRLKITARSLLWEDT